MSYTDNNNPISIAYQELSRQSVSFWSDKRYGDYLNAQGNLSPNVTQLLPNLPKRQNSLSTANSTPSLTDTVEQTAKEYLKLGFWEKVWRYFTEEEAIMYYLELTELMTLYRLKDKFEANQKPAAWALYKDSILPKRTGIWDNITGSWRTQVQDEMSRTLNAMYQTLKTTVLGVIVNIFHQKLEEKATWPAIKGMTRQEILRLNSLFTQILGVNKTTTTDQQSILTGVPLPAYQQVMSQVQKWQRFLEEDFLSKALPTKAGWLDKRIGYARDNKPPQQAWRFDGRWRATVRKHFTELEKNIKKAIAKTAPKLKYNALRKLVDSSRYKPKEQFGYLLEKYSQGLTVEQLNVSKARELADFCCYVEGMRQNYEAFVTSYKTTCQQEALSSMLPTPERGVTTENEDKWSPKLVVKKAQLKDKDITHTWENDYAQYQKFLSLVMQRTEAIEWGVIWVEESLVEVRRQAKKEVTQLFHCLSLRYHPDKHKDSEELHSNRQKQLNNTKKKCHNELAAIATAPPPSWIKSQPYFEQLMQREDGVIKQTIIDFEQKLEQQAQRNTTDTAELKTDTAELKTDTAELKTDTTELKKENKELKERLERLERLFEQSQEKQQNSQDKPKGQEKRSNQSSSRGGSPRYFKDSQGKGRIPPQSPRADEKKEDKSELIASSDVTSDDTSAEPRSWVP